MKGEFLEMSRAFRSSPLCRKLYHTAFLVELVN